MKKILLSSFLAISLSLNFVGCAEIEHEDDNDGVAVGARSTTTTRSIRAY